MKDMMKKLWWMAWLAVAACGVQADDAVRTNLVSLQTQAVRQVPNDIAQALLAVEAEDPDPARLADAVNRTMAWVLDAAKRVKEVEVQTGTYSTYPVYTKNTLSHWRARQDLRLQSRDVEALSRLLATLQSRLQLKAMTFSVSPERRQKVENELITEALGAFQERVAVVRAALGFHRHDIVEININTGGPVYRPMEAMRAMAADVSTPALEAGTSEVTVVVSGTVRLE